MSIFIRAAPLYFDSYEFIHDQNVLASLTLDEADTQRWLIAIKWRQSNVLFGNIPTSSESHVVSMFVTGEISLQEMLTRIGKTHTQH